MDLEQARKAFYSYASHYDKTNAQINFKTIHILKTAQISRKIAIELELSQEDIELAELIGLLHDIGRFEQITKYHTLNDKQSINHAQCGVQVLWEEGYIREFIKEPTYDAIIKTAILNHNKNTMEEGLEDRTLLHCKIIRDADKTDIYRVLLTEEILDTYGTTQIGKEKISPQILEDFFQYHKVDYAHRKNAIDLLVAHLAYVFDYNFNVGLKIIQENQYIPKLIEKVELKEKETIQIIDNMQKQIEQYIENRLTIKG